MIIAAVPETEAARWRVPERLCSVGRAPKVSPALTVPRTTTTMPATTFIWSRLQVHDVLLSPAKSQRREL